ncbi:hypothetical protein OQA88_7500 [Cercophora sp. LCS_1]
MEGTTRPESLHGWPFPSKTSSSRAVTDGVGGAGEEIEMRSLSRPGYSGAATAPPAQFVHKKGGKFAAPGPADPSPRLEERSNDPEPRGNDGEDESPESDDSGSNPFGISGTDVESEGVGEDEMREGAVGEEGGEAASEEDSDCNPFRDPSIKLGKRPAVAPSSPRLPHCAGPSNPPHPASEEQEPPSCSFTFTIEEPTPRSSLRSLEMPDISSIRRGSVLRLDPVQPAWLRSAGRGEEEVNSNFRAQVAGFARYQKLAALAAGIFLLAMMLLAAAVTAAVKEKWSDDHISLAAIICIVLGSILSAAFAAAMAALFSRSLELYDLEPDLWVEIPAQEQFQPFNSPIWENRVLRERIRKLEELVTKRNLAIPDQATSAFDQPRGAKPSIRPVFSTTSIGTSAKGSSSKAPANQTTEPVVNSPPKTAGPSTIQASPSIKSIFSPERRIRKGTTKVISPLRDRTSGNAASPGQKSTPDAKHKLKTLLNRLPTTKPDEVNDIPDREISTRTSTRPLLDDDDGMNEADDVCDTPSLQEEPGFGFDFASPNSQVKSTHDGISKHPDTPHRVKLSDKFTPKSAKKNGSLKLFSKSPPKSEPQAGPSKTQASETLKESGQHQDTNFTIDWDLPPRSAIELD